MSISEEIAGSQPLGGLVSPAGVDVGADLLEAELVRLDREPPAVLVQVDEAAMAFDAGREARDFEVTEGHAEVVGEGHHRAELEVARDWW